MAKRTKYNNTIVRDENGKKLYDSIKEQRRHQELLWMEKASEISCLKHQVRIPLKGESGKKICDYIADFTYLTKDKIFVVEDSKGVKTPMYNLKKKWLKIDKDIIIKET